MASDFAQSAVNVGGSCNEFVQTDFISAQGWGNQDRKKRKGGLTTGKGLAEGCCSALSAMYLGSRGDWSVFKNIIVTPGGLAHVRGLQNLNSHAGSIGSLNTQAYKDIMKLFGVTYGGPERHEANSKAADGAIAASRQDGMYYFSFWGPWGGHTVALYRKGTLTKAFDPNFGEATVPAAQLSRFVSWWLPRYYPSISSWVVQRYML